ncbi:hypothetical protein HN695_05955 [Candidatus Woesearchaeota archaeon]|jgi:hypothetical protein|nr:hypothetical protein [Candidatus Woesearchaeota archaeon]MBT5272575.1 hypothetical protein [Candidatus Woesearchaeota archaeon]MBT6040568.1 hypothetical protein [Candidatus Woesearchaeota archaeon]MBT6337127.1 hypothetical protein [Candidatus Woesearchaeota archaeon]MBT7927853.1 hypothetical protein [Candidatus Woesearchaeota archaeon]
MSKLTNQIKKIASATAAGALYFMLSTGIATADTGMENRATQQEASQGIEAKLVASGYPEMKVDLEKYDLNDLLVKLGGTLKKGFSRKASGKIEEYTDGTIGFGVATDSTNKLIPMIDLQYDNQVIDRFLFSKINSIKWAIGELNGDYNYHILITAREPSTNKAGLQGFYERQYDIVVKDNPQLAASYVVAIARKYANNGDVINKERVEKCECPEIICEEPRAPVYMTPRIMEGICSGNPHAIPQGYDLVFLGQVDYDDCVFRPEESNSGLNEMIAGAIATLKPENGIMLMCGNADEKSAKECKLPVENNFQLSFLRGRILGNYLEQNQQTSVRGVSLVPYPMGTELNEKSTKVYYLFQNGN